MPLILKIGTQEWLIKSDAQALAVFRGMQSAVAVDSHFDVKTGETLYFPDEKAEEYRCCYEIELKQVKLSQLRGSDPSKPKPAPAGIRGQPVIGSGKTQLLLGEGKR
jgi:hypothetical protein